MLNFTEKINENMESIKEQGKLMLRELLSIRQQLSDWCSEGLTAQLTSDDELKKILLGQANELVASQMTFENFDEAYHLMNRLCQEFTENIRYCWLGFDGMTIDKLLCIPQLCPHCNQKIEDTDEFCPSCGQYLEAKRKYEPPVTVSVKKCKCGRTHHVSDKFCPSCGKEE